MPAGGNFVGCCGPDSTSCQNPTEPVATVGLCLGDGRPIAVTVVRDCEGNTTQEGWLDLTTGVWSAGPPPEGTTTCDGGRPQFEVGQWCDLDADGQTIAPVLVEYEYGPEGQLVGVRTLTPAGDPYEVEGTLGLCPGADEDGSPPEPCRDCETITLCDTIDPSPGESGAEPVVVTFLRTICRDCDGTVTSVVDTELDGTTAYTVQGEASACHPPQPVEDESPPEPCLHCETLTLCDTTAVDTSPGEGVEILWQVVSVDPDPESDPGRGYLFTLAPEDDPSQTAVVRVTSGTTANTNCQPSEPGELVFHNTNDLRFYLDEVAQQASYLRVDLIDFDGFEPVQIHSDSQEPTRLGGTAVWNPDHTQIVPTEDNGIGMMFWDNPPPEFGYRIWNTGGGNSCTQLSFVMATTVPAEPSPGDVQQVPFLRTVCRDCAGEVVSTTDTTPAGDPYTVTGEVEVCGDTPSQHTPPEPCRDSSSLLLCDIPTSDDYTADAAAEDVTDQLVDRDSHLRLPGGVPAVWDSGEGTIPPDPDPSAVEGDQVYRMVAGAITPTGNIPACNAGTVVVTAALDITNTGPTDGLGYTGRVQLLVGETNAASSGLLTGFPVGETQRVQMTARVPADDFVAGAVRLLVTAETFHGGPKGWTLSGFAATYTVDMPEGGCETQFLRHVRRDCETGQIIDISDTTLDGQPYEVAGDVGECQPVEQRELCNDTELVPLCDTAADGTVVPFLRRLVFDCYGQTTSAADLTLDGQPYEPTGQIGLCHPEIDLDGVTLDTGPDREFHILCDAEGVAFLRRYSVDIDGETTLFDSELDGTTPYMPVEPVGLCSIGLDPNDTSPPELCGVTQVLERARCDDLTEESPGEVVCYTELIGVNCHGQLQQLGTFTPDLAEPYTPTNPVPCQEVSTPGDPIVGVQTQRLQLDPGQAWAATTVPLLQTVTISAHGGEGQVTTEAGVSTLFEGESVTWSVVHEYETVLRGPLTVQATSGVVTVTYTEGVTA